MDRLCRELNLLVEENGVVRLPFLVKGRLVLPPPIRREEIEAAFYNAPGAHYLKLPDVQLLREPIIARRAEIAAHPEVRPGFLYQVMPALRPFDLLETDFDRLLAGPYALSVDQILGFIEMACTGLKHNPETLSRVRRLCSMTLDYPEAFLDGIFAALPAAFDAQAALRMMNAELAAWQMPGSRFLNGWAEVPGVTSQVTMPGLALVLGQALQDRAGPPTPSGPRWLRAMPTRQLHITAGNAPEIPLVSALRLALTKSAGVIKLPFGATLTGGMLAVLLTAVAPDHPLTQNLSLVYWQGGDEDIENVLFSPGAFDRIVVWGGAEAVSSVQARAGLTRLVAFNPRYGVSLIGGEAAADHYASAALAAATDTMIYNQKSCTASLVHYVEGNLEQARTYAQKLSQRLGDWDALAPPYLSPTQQGQLKRLRRGKYAAGEWIAYPQPGDHTSTVLLLPGELDIFDHPMCRLVVVRPVADLRQALRYLHAGVSTAGVFPEARRLALRDAIAARGVSNIFPLGQCDQILPGAPHDGMLVLSELVEWKNS